MHLAYLMVNRPTCGVPYTLDEAYPFVQDKLVALGLPDVLFESEDSFTRLLARQLSHSVDVVLGLSRADRPEKVDMVDIDDKGRVRGIVIKPNKTQLVYSWIIALWKPRFTHFMHEYLAAMSGSTGEQSELFLGDILEAAISCGLSVEGVPVSDDSCLDIGTPEDLHKAVKDFAVQYP